MKTLVKQGLCMLAMGVGFSLPSQAVVTDPLIEGAKLCTSPLPRFEREYGIPTHLLSAIASTESGRYHGGLKIKVPWPWTINAQGKGYYFDSKEEAIAAAKKLMARGVKSFDVGCMQVNMHHHGRAFSSLEQAFNPQENVAYAAAFLRNLYQDRRSWKQAASDYHSKTPTRGTKYAGVVYTNWYQIIDKLRQAKLHVPESAISAVNEKAPAAKSKKVGVKTLTSITPTAHKTEGLPEQRGRKVAAHEKPKMKMITVSDKSTSRGKSVMVVKPEIKVVSAPVEVVVANVRPATVAYAIPQTNIIQASQHITDNSAGGKGPRFIFND